MSNLTEILFGTVRTAHVSDLAKGLGVSERTIRRWKRNPEGIPIGKVAALIRIQRIPQEEVEELWELLSRPTLKRR